MNERSIFTAALDIADPAERAAYLDQACGQEPGLRGHIEGLLAEQGQLGSFLARPLAAPTVSVGSDPVTEGPGTTIGPYKLLQQIGEGGMGVVYMAAQETPVRRKVALKIIKPGMDSAQVVARFEAERQALAMMDHTNIAKVFDAGTTDSGRPYFVMELVHGVPITTYCDSNQLTPRERLTLFVPVCLAIQHAHQKGIIHRDIKPSNVLVTMYDDKPVPKVIDFGVAKAVEQRLTERTLFTQYGALVGTFEYMSPEQAEMNAFGVDTRSDVFSLGVLLYELLTGTTPLERPRLRTAALGELIRLIKEEDPERPSVRLSGSGDLPKLAAARKTEPARLSRLVRGEVDWIVMKCLEKDRTRRYETASSLARDVERHLNDEAVEACPPSAGYRLRKLARKHKLPLGVAAGFALLVLAGAGVSTWQAVRATQAERRAVAERQRAVAAEHEALASERNAILKRRDAEAARQSLRQSLYASDLKLAQSSGESGNLVGMHNLLAQHRPGPGEADLRGFEWYFLRRLGANTHTFKMGTSPSRCLFSGDGARCVLVQGIDSPTTGNTLEWECQLWDVASGQMVSRYTPFPGETLVTFRFSQAFSIDGKRTTFNALIRDAAGRDQWRLTAWDWESSRELFTCRADAAAVKFDRPARRLAAAVRRSGDSGGCDLRIIEVDGGKELLTIRLPDRTVTHAIALSPDGTHIAAATKPAGPENAQVAGEVRVWEAGSGKEVLRFAVGSGRSNLAYSPDGTRLVVAGDGETCFLRDAHSGVQLLELTTAENPAYVSAVAFSPDGSRLAAVAMDEKVRIWDVGTHAQKASRSPERILKVNNARFEDVVFSADGRFLSAPSRGIISRWELSTPPDHPVVRWPDWTEYTVTTTSADGSRFAAAFLTRRGRDEVKVWDDAGKVRFATSHAAYEESRRSGFARGGSVLLSRDGARLAYSSLVGFTSDAKRKGVSLLRVWDVATGRELFHHTGEGDMLTPTNFSPDGRFLATEGVLLDRTISSLSVEAFVSIWDLDTGKEQLHLDAGAKVEALVFSPDGRRLAAGLALYGFGRKDDQLRVWDAVTGKVIWSRKWPDGAAGQLAYSRDGTLLAIAVGQYMGNEPGELKVLDAASGTELRSLTGHSYPSENLAFSPDGLRLASSGTPYRPDTAEVKLWEVAGGRELLTLKGNGAGKLAFSPDGRRLSYISSGVGERVVQVQVWDATPLPDEPPPVAHSSP